MPTVTTHGHVQSPTTHHRDVVKLINQVLLKRADVLCEQDQLQTSRKFVVSSLNDIDEALDRERSGTRIEEADWIIDCATAATSNDNYEAGQSCMDSGTCLDQTYVTVCEHDVATNAGKRLRDLLKTYKKDCDHLEKREEAFKASARSLSNLEYRLKEALEYLAVDLRAITGTPKFDKDVIDVVERSSDSTATEEPERNVSPLLLEYYRSKGEVGICRERLQELDYHHEDGLVERELLRQNGHSVDVSDEAFEQDYRIRRQELQKDLDSAKADVDTVVERCQDAGIDIDTHTRIVSDDSVSLISAWEIQGIETSDAQPPWPDPRPSKSKQMIRWFRSMIGTSEN